MPSPSSSLAHLSATVIHPLSKDEPKRHSWARIMNSWAAGPAMFILSGHLHGELDGHYAENEAARVCYVVIDRKSTRLNSSHVRISYAVFCLKKKTIERSQLDDLDEAFRPHPSDGLGSARVPVPLPHLQRDGRVAGAVGIRETLVPALALLFL